MMETREGYKKTKIGWVPEEWNYDRLEQCCDIIQDGTHFSPKSKAGPCKYLTSKNIKFGTLDLSNVSYISAEEHEPIYKRCPVIYGDILLTKDGANTGNAAINTLNEPFSLLSSVALIRANDQDAVNSYLVQYLLSPKGQYMIKDAMAGQAITRITLKTIKSFKIPLPPLPEQQKIASILSTVDEKIQSIEEQINQTEQLKKGLMNKLLTEGIGHTEFKDTKIGRIPKSWDVVKVGDISKIIRGASPRPKGDPRYYGGDVPRLMGQDVSRDGKFVFPKIDFLTAEGAKRSRFLPKGTLVLTCSGTVGIPTILGVDACVHDGFIALAEISNSQHIEFLYYVFSSLQMRFDRSATHGGVFTNLTTQIIKDFLISSPPIEEQIEITSIIVSVDEKIDVLHEKQSAYETLKKGLMAQLLTGQMRVKI